METCQTFRRSPCTYNIPTYYKRISISIIVRRCVIRTAVHLDSRVLLVLYYFIARVCRADHRSTRIYVLYIGTYLYTYNIRTVPSAAHVRENKERKKRGENVTRYRGRLDFHKTNGDPM